jgi:hypothetical protein
MEGNERRVEGMGGERFNETRLKVFLSEREKNLRRLEGIRYLSFFNSPKLGSFGGGEEGSGSTYFKKFEIVKFTLMMSIYICFFKISKWGP